MEGGVVMICDRCGSKTAIKKIRSTDGDKLVDECTNRKCRRKCLCADISPEVVSKSTDALKTA